MIDIPCNDIAQSIHAFFYLKHEIETLDEREGLGREVGNSRIKQYKFILGIQDSENDLEKIIPDVKQALEKVLLRCNLPAIIRHEGPNGNEEYNFKQEGRSIILSRKVYERINDKHFPEEFLTL